MYRSKKAVLVFGVGPLQRSIVERAKNMGLYTVGVDPAEDAVCREAVDAFEIVGGQDYEGTCAVIEKYGIDAIVTAATDKPLVMMAHIAERYGFPFFSAETAICSTDKFKMMDGKVPCAKGRLVKSANEVEDFEYPVIVKPRDNSGSRGVKLCRSKDELDYSISEALDVSHYDNVLVEEFIEGSEFSIEGLHFDGKSEVIQFTENSTTEFPYNVETGHIQPANISEDNRERIRQIVRLIGDVMKFENCPSHTELKINNRGIFVIETSPRLGGDYITSTLTPLSTGVNMEDQLLHIALGDTVSIHPASVQYSGIRFFSFEEGRKVQHLPDPSVVKNWPHVVDYSLSLKVGDEVNRITSSLNRYGHIILQTNNRDEMEDEFDKYVKEIKKTMFL